jgi:hypothetical protein
VLRNFVVYLIAASLVCINIAHGAPLAPISTEQIATSEANAARVLVLSILERQDLQGRLEEYGVSRADAERRVAAMTDQEVLQLAEQIQSAPAGGDIGVLGVALIVFLVLLATDILGYTKIFPFTKQIK